MFRKSALPELLAPAGNFECLVAAVAGGADAVYVGGKRFGARAYAKNFDTDELARALSYCHLHGVKLYVTVNTLVLDKELPELIEYVAELYRIGVDAIIIADLGAIAEIRKYIPDMEIHASTQMSVHNSQGVNEAVKLGASRVVLARELSIENIRSGVEKSEGEIEVFLHGALCVCHSGQCLFSSMVGGRSGNRGECAQPCRLPFNDKYPLSLKDLSLANHIKELIESGVASLKIEGRMKSADYVYTVTKIYRRLLDESRCATVNEESELKRVFSRGGFTDGYFYGDHGKNMTGIRTEEEKRESREASSGGFLPERVRVKARVELTLGNPAKMWLYLGERQVLALGDVPNVAETAPLDCSGVKERLSKMGNTFLSLSPEDIELILDEGINLPPSSLNALRRSAAAAMECFERPEIKINYKVERFKDKVKDGFVTAQFLTQEAYDRAVANDRDALASIDVSFLPLERCMSVKTKSLGVSLPPVITDGEIDKVREMLEKAKKMGKMYALVSNIGQISIAKSAGFELFGDFRLNVTNYISAKVYKELGISHIILSPELTLRQARDIGGGVITYGRIPLMITERCFIKENFGCERCGKTYLTDRRREAFPMIRAFEHRNIILNSLPTYLGDRTRDLDDNRIVSRHLIFSIEGGDEIKSVIKAHKNGEPLAKSKVRRAGRR